MIRTIRNQGHGPAALLRRHEARTWRRNPGPISPRWGDDKPFDQFAGKAGRVIHDARGNAVWDWVKETSRIAIDSTSRLLKRLEVPELKVEDTQPNNELSLESERDAGGGYDPYGGSKSGKAPGTRGGLAAGGGPAAGRGLAAGRGPAHGGASGFNAGRSGSGSSGAVADPRASGKGGAANTGGGYDPYGKGVSKPTGRKP